MGTALRGRPSATGSPCCKPYRSGLPLARPFPHLTLCPSRSSSGVMSVMSARKTARCHHPGTRPSQRFATVQRVPPVLNVFLRRCPHGRGLKAPPESSYAAMAIQDTFCRSFESGASQAGRLTTTVYACPVLLIRQL